MMPTPGRRRKLHARHAQQALRTRVKQNWTKLYLAAKKEYNFGANRTHTQTHPSNSTEMAVV